MRIRTSNVLGDPVPNASADFEVKVGDGASRIRIDAPGYLPRYRIVFNDKMFSDEELSVVLLMDPETMIVEPGRERACYANILAKMAKIEPQGEPLTSFLVDREPFGLRRDRAFVWVTPEFVEALDGSPAFRGAPGILHHSPEGFEREQSVKTADDERAGLQIVLHRKEDEWLGEFDIDLRTGVAHWFEALGNAIKRQKTDPFIVVQLLVQQRIDPGYEFRAGLPEAE